MKKKICLITAGILAFGSMCYAAGSYSGGINLNINSYKPDMKNEVYEIDDNTYVPLREFCENLDIPVSWDEETKTANVKSGYKYLYHSNGNWTKGEFGGEPIDDKNCVFNGIVPDEKTALEYGKKILEGIVGKELEYELVDKDGEIWGQKLQVNYNENNNNWNIYSDVILPKKGILGVSNGLTRTYYCSINKTTGEVTYICTKSVDEQQMLFEYEKLSK